MNGWWEDYTNCKLDNLSPDTNLLITDCDGSHGGGVTEAGPPSNSTRSVANVNGVENLPYLADYGDGFDEYSMSAPIHEIAHSLIGGITDDDGDGYTEHDLGNSYLHDNEVYGSPIGMAYISQKDDISLVNECGMMLAEPDSSTHVDFRYSKCAGSKME